jgi:hypothetical protein
MAKEATSTALTPEHPAKKSEHPSQPAETFASHSDIAALAFQLWEDRGCPDGSPEEDWYRAEHHLTTKTE